MLLIDLFFNKCEAYHMLIWQQPSIYLKAPSMCGNAVITVTMREVGEPGQTVNVFINSGQSLVQSLSIHLHIRCPLQRPQEQLQDRQTHRY